VTGVEGNGAQVAKQAEQEKSDLDEVWIESPATGRKKKSTRGKLAILELSGWKECDEPKDDDPLIVAPFPSVAPGELDETPADPPAETTRTARTAAAQKEGS
jgi:hypothetical protein